MNELQLVFGERTYVVGLREIRLDPSASDNQVREVAERHFDLVKGALRNHQVTRPGRGRILVSERAVFG